jgi:queuine tRNA-ribosyltransferase
MHWDGPILTDSGGFQVFSLGDLRRIEEEGVRFQSHLDGSAHTLTPESSVAIQEALGADIMMVFDECIPYPAERAYVATSTARSARWAARSKAARTDASAALFGIVQGGMEQELRRQSVEQLLEIGFDGYALGGLSVGERAELMYQVMEWTLPLLPAAQPRYVMGVGTPENLVEAVARGADLFDCVMPTPMTAYSSPASASSASSSTATARITARSIRPATAWFADVFRGLTSVISTKATKFFLRS